MNPTSILVNCNIASQKSNSKPTPKSKGNDQQISLNHDFIAILIYIVLKKRNESDIERER